MKARGKPGNSTGGRKIAGSHPVSASKNPDTQTDGNFVEQHGFLILTGFVTLLALFIYRDFLFSGAFYLFKDIGSDSLNMTYPSLVHISDYLRNEGFPLWSFSQGLGQAAGNAMNDPFNWIIYLGGSKNVIHTVIWSEITKLFATAFFFFLFLQTRKLKASASIVGSLLYTFSGFVLIGSGWSLFSTEACYLALMLLGFEKVYSGRNYWLFPIPVMLLSILQPFDLYLYGLLLTGYFLFRFFTTEKMSRPPFFMTTGRLILLGGLGLLMGSALLYLFMRVILDSPRVGGSASYTDDLLARSPFFLESGKYYLTSLMRILHNDLLGNGIKYQGWFNYLEAPLFYIGILPLLLLPQFFISENRQRKTVMAILLGVVTLLVIFPFLRYSIWLFSGDYFRGFSLFISLPVLLAGVVVVSSFDSGKKINPALLIITAVILLVLLHFPYKGDDQMIRADVRGWVRNMILLYTLVILSAAYLKEFRYRGLVLLVLVAIELGFFNYSTLKERDVLTRTDWRQRNGYNDETMDALGVIKSVEKPFYRVNKDFSSSPSMHFSSNDAKAQGFFGSRSYSSFNQFYYIRFLEEMNIIIKGDETMSRWAPGVSGRPLLQHLMSTKYQILEKPAQPVVSYLNDSVGTFGQLRLLRAKVFLPFGFTYDSIVPYSVFKRISAMQKETLLQKACVIDDSLLQHFSSLPAFVFGDTLSDYQLSHLLSDAGRRKQDTLAISVFSENRIRGKIKMEKAGILFFSIPYDNGWHGKLDGNPTGLFLCNVGFTGMLVPPGDHKVELFYRPPWLRFMLILTIAGWLAYATLIIWNVRNKRKNIMATVQISSGDREPVASPPSVKKSNTP